MGVLSRTETGPVLERRRVVSWAAVFVLGVWAVMTGADCWFVATYGRNCPYADEWAMVPWLCGRGKVTAEWIFYLHNEHRIPLVRLVLLGLYRVTHMNFVAGAYMNAAILSGASLLFIDAARRSRGEVAWTDAIFPAMLLSWIHCENLLSGWQAQYTLAIGLSAIYLWLVMRLGRLNRWRFLAPGLSLVALAGCGANGVLLAFFLGASLLFLSRKDTVVWVGCLALAALLIFLRPGPSGGGAEPERTAEGLARNAAGFLGASMGPAFCPAVAPYGVRLPLILPDTYLGTLARVWPIFAVLGVVACILGAVAAVRNTGGKVPALCFWLSGLATLGALTWTRRVGWEVFDRPETLRMLTTRYALLLSPIPLGAYLLCDVVGFARARRFLAVVAIIAAILAFPAGTWTASRRSAAIDSFLADALAMQSTDAATLHASRLDLKDAFGLGDSMRLLRDHRHPSFVGIPAGNR
jgi:hypothetical protein